MQCRLQLVRWHSDGHHNPCVLQVLPTSSWQGALQSLMACAAAMAVWACVFQPLAADAKSLFGNPWSSSSPSSSTPATLEMKVGISLCTRGHCRPSKQALASQSLRRELNRAGLIRHAALSRRHCKGLSSHRMHALHYRSGLLHVSNCQEWQKAPVEGRGRGEGWPGHSLPAAPVCQVWVRLLMPAGPSGAQERAV